MAAKAAMEQPCRPVFRTKQQLAHDLTKCFYRDRRNPRLVDRMLENTHGGHAASFMPKSLREGRLDFWRDVVPPFVVDDIQQTALGPDLFTLTYQVGLTYFSERAWGFPHRINSTYDNKIKAQALVHIPRKYPEKKASLHVLDWGVPRLNGYGEPEAGMDVTGRTWSEDLLCQSVTSTSWQSASPDSGSPANAARVQRLAARARQLMHNTSSELGRSGASFGSERGPFDAQTPDLSVGLLPNNNERVRADIYGTLKKKGKTVQPSMMMQEQLASKKWGEGDSMDSRMRSTTQSLPNLHQREAYSVYDQKWNTVVGWGSEWQAKLHQTHGKAQKTNQQRPSARCHQGVRNLYPFIYS